MLWWWTCCLRLRLSSHPKSCSLPVVRHWTAGTDRTEQTDKAKSTTAQQCRRCIMQVLPSGKLGAYMRLSAYLLDIDCEFPLRIWLLAVERASCISWLFCRNCGLVACSLQSNVFVGSFVHLTLTSRIFLFRKLSLEHEARPKLKARKQVNQDIDVLKARKQQLKKRSEGRWTKRQRCSNRRNVAWGR